MWDNLDAPGCRDVRGRAGRRPPRPGAAGWPTPGSRSRSTACRPRRPARVAPLRHRSAGDDALRRRRRPRCSTIPGRPERELWQGSITDRGTAHWGGASLARRGCGHRGARRGAARAEPPARRAHRLVPAGRRDRRGRDADRRPHPRGRRGDRPRRRHLERAGLRDRGRGPRPGWVLRVEAHLATAWSGDVLLADPDGIVVDACFTPAGGCGDLLAAAPRWVAEPLTDWLTGRWDECRTYRYLVDGADRPQPPRRTALTSVGADPTILHVDMDAFFVSCELRRRPELRGRRWSSAAPATAGVVAAASYEARAHGVHSAMPSARARRLCPQAVFLPGDHRYYGEISREVMAVFRSLHAARRAAVARRGLPRRGRRPPPARLGGRDRRTPSGPRCSSTRSLACSVGVAPNKFLAKLGSQAAKPRPTRRGHRRGPG